MDNFETQGETPCILSSHSTIKRKALALLANPQTQAAGATNGLIIITSRTASDALYRQISSSTLYEADDFKGPGVFSPGDAAMAELLQDHGCSTPLVPEWLLNPNVWDPSGTYFIPPFPGATVYYHEYIYGGGGGPAKLTDTNYACSAALVIVSGSGGSFDMPPPNTNGVGIIMGEHSCIGDRSLNGKSSIYMHSSINSGDVAGTALGDVRYMKAVNPSHPIIQAKGCRQPVPTPPPSPSKAGAALVGRCPPAGRGGALPRRWDGEKSDLPGMLARRSSIVIFSREAACFYSLERREEHF